MNKGYTLLRRLTILCPPFSRHCFKWNVYVVIPGRLKSVRWRSYVCAPTLYIRVASLVTTKLYGVFSLSKFCALCGSASNQCDHIFHYLHAMGYVTRFFEHDTRFYTVCQGSVSMLLFISVNCAIVLSSLLRFILLWWYIRSIVNAVKTYSVQNNTKG